MGKFKTETRSTEGISTTLRQGSLRHVQWKRSSTCTSTVLSTEISSPRTYCSTRAATPSWCVLCRRSTSETETLFLRSTSASRRKWAPVARRGRSAARLSTWHQKSCSTKATTPPSTYGHSAFSSMNFCAECTRTLHTLFSYTLTIQAAIRIQRPDENL